MIVFIEVFDFNALQISMIALSSIPP